MGEMCLMIRVMRFKDQQMYSEIGREKGIYILGEKTTFLSEIPQVFGNGKMWENFMGKVDQKAMRIMKIQVRIRKICIF